MTQPPLWKHQEQAIEMAKRLQNFALFFEMGTGKTRTAIEILRHRFTEEKRYMRTLIVGPVIVVNNWKHEIEKYSKIPPEKILPLLGPGSKRVGQMLTKMMDAEGNPLGGVVITNYEALLMKELFALLKAWGPEILILDESHRCKDPRSYRTQRAVTLADTAKYRYILSGTPILNTPMDVFSQYRILDGGQTFGKNFFAFRATYFYDKNAGMPKQRYFPKWTVKPGALEEMNKKIYSRAMRVTKAECLDLPPLVKKTIEVELTPEQKKLYEEMKRDFITFIGDKACVATLAITKALRLQQIVSGYAKLDSGTEKTLGTTPRSEALEELLEEITPNHKVIVWAVFKENYEQIRKVCEKLKVEYVEVHGEIPNQQKFANVDRFNGDPSCRVLIGHPGSGGIGINLVSASYSIWFSRNFSLDADLQAEARNHRGGSEIHSRVTRIDLVARGTIDELVLKSLADKQAISDKMLFQWKDSL